MSSLSEDLVSVWRQSMAEGRPEVEIEGQRVPVRRTRGGLLVLTLRHGDFALEGIEQNADKPSRWGELARAGKRIMQFRYRGRYVANVCDGTLLRYPAWKTMGLPD